jgi:hypothetical protein
MTRANERLPWRYVVLCALLWGAGATLAVELVQPVGDLTSWEFVALTAGIATQWTVGGFVWTAGVKLAEESGRPLAFLPLVMVLAWGASILMARLPFGQVRAGGDAMSNLLMNIPLFDLAAYLFWSNLVYGGLYSFGYLATRRAQRLRHRLAELRLARNEADIRLREARLQAVRGQIQPAVLLDALSALQDRYAEDIDAGNALFDQIIDFLRAAMPGLRSGASTMGAELNILSAYANLLDGLDPGRRHWRLNLADAPMDLPFPPMRLLPVLDQISRAAPLGSTIEVSTARTAGSYVLSIGAEPPLPKETASRMQAVIRRSLGGGVGAAQAVQGLIAQLRFPADGDRQPVPLFP